MIFSHGSFDPQYQIDHSEISLNTLQLLSLLIISRQPMPWTWYDLEQLWNGIHEIDDLRNKEQQQCF